MLSPERFKAIVSGHAQGCVPGMLRGLFTTISIPWSAVVATRNYLYDAGFLRVYPPEIPVVSVGNLTLGGTGKTPMVAWLAQYLMNRGGHPGIVSRGYKASNVAESEHRSCVSTNSSQDNRFALFQKYNDEARELDLLLNGQVPQFLYPDRVKAVQALLAFDPACDTIILDDAFQHRRMGRTVNIVLLDALDPFGGEKMFPRGFLRESLNSLTRADIVLLSRADLIDDATAQTIKKRVLKIAPKVVFGRIAHRPVAVRSLQGKYLSFDSWKNERKESDSFYAFCGIGNPEGFFQGLARENIPIAYRRILPDHCQYTPKLLEEISDEADRCHAAGILTTLKDFVKIDKITHKYNSLQAIEIGIDFIDGKQEFVNRLDNMINLQNHK